MDYYSLRDLVFFYENVDVTIGEYRKKVIQAKLTAVVEPDRVNLKDYLLGNIESCPQIDYAVVNSYIASNKAAEVVESQTVADTVDSEQIKESSRLMKILL